MSDAILAPISIGELFDKISILEIKATRLTGAAKLSNVRRELKALYPIAEQFAGHNVDDAKLGLWSVNLELWETEDRIRVCEARGDFGPEFIALARAVYQTNDRRAALKRQINTYFGSAIVEEKSYADG